MKTKGFTLIELLVVISIIGVLASTILGSLSDARAAARDAQRELDIKTIQNALEIYYLENGRYPFANWKYSDAADWNTFFGSPVPVDPINETGNAGSGAFNYTYTSRNGANWCNNQAYILIYNKENSNDTLVGPGPVELCDGSAPNYTNAFEVGMSPRS